MPQDPARPKRRPVPGTPIKKLSPFVTDTLFPAVGGSYPIHRSRGFSPLGPENRAATFAPPRPQQGDTAVVFYKEPTDEVQAHEAGHILDHRGLIPSVYGDVEARRRPHLGRVNTQDDYFRASRDEYVAEAFARALLSGRKGFADSTAVDKQFPGAIELIRWLQTRPPFAKDQEQQPDTSLAELLDRALERDTLRRPRPQPPT